MKTNLLRFTALLLALLTTGALAACGGNGSGTKQTTAEKPSEMPTASPSGDETADVEPEPEETNILRRLIKASVAVVLPKNPGIYLSEQAKAFVDAVRSEIAAELTLSGKPAEGESAVYFGKVAKTPKALYEDLAAGDFAIDATEDKLFIVGGSDWALGAAVEQIPKLLAEERVELPYVYRAEKQPQLLRVGTFNIQHGSHVNCDFSVIGKDILKAGLDIVGIQEVDMFTSRNKKKDTMKELSEATGFAYYEYSKTIDLEGGQYGHGILSRYPILSYETVLMKGGGEQRAYGHAVIEVGGVQIDWYNAHFAWPEKGARRTQFMEISRDFNAKDKAILTADMNAVGTKEYESFFKGVGYTNGNEGDYYHFNSCPEDGAIDNVIYKDCFVLLNAGMDNKVEHSDHYMVWAELCLPPKK